MGTGVALSLLCIAALICHASCSIPLRSPYRRPPSPSPPSSPKVTGNAGKSKVNDLMICRPVTEVFGSIAQGKADSGLLQLFRGPVGPPGIPGATGPFGETALTDQQKVAAMIHNKTSVLRAQLYTYQRELDELKGHRQVLSSEEKTLSDSCMTKFNAPIHVNRTCYLLIGGSSLRWDFKEAESNCTKLGGYLADIATREIFNRLYDFVDSTFSTPIEAWTGMRFQDQKLVLTNGGKAERYKWMAYNPKVPSQYSSYYSSYTHVTVTIDSGSRTKGLKNINPDRKFSYAVCHFGLDGALPTRITTTARTTTEDYDYYYNYF